MASTTASSAKGRTAANARGNNLPSLSAMAVNDTKTVTGAKMTMASVRKLIKGRQGKLFTYRRSARRQYVITRVK